MIKFEADNLNIDVAGLNVDNIKDIVQLCRYGHKVSIHVSKDKLSFDSEAVDFYFNDQLVGDHQSFLVRNHNNKLSVQSATEIEKYYRVYNEKKKYPVVTLCGSSRFKEEFISEAKRLTLEGNIVLPLNLYGHSDMPEIMSTETKVMLDDMHKRRIDISDSIHVINPNGYIGESTRNEIIYAYSKRKHMTCMEDLNIKTIKEKILKARCVCVLFASNLKQVARNNYSISAIQRVSFNEEENRPETFYTHNFELSSLINRKHSGEKDIKVLSYDSYPDVLFIADLSMASYGSKNIYVASREHLKEFEVDGSIDFDRHYGSNEYERMAKNEFIKKMDERIR